MTKIFDLVNFHVGYGKQVRLLEYFYDEDINREHMRGYVPIRSHREAFLDLAQSQLPSKESKGKVFMLTGSYGTGKSHLCLMLANYFSLKPKELEMVEFFANWAKRDKDSMEKVRNWRGDGRYLVAPCEFGEARPFEDMLLSAIQTALEREGDDSIILNTHFKGALRQIEIWEQRERAGEPSGVFSDFLTFLGGDDVRQELVSLKVNLGTHKTIAMDLFQETYRQATGQKLSLLTDSLLAILKDLLSNPEFQQRYKGLVILADEFGYALSEGRVSMSVFHSFAEMSKDGVAGMDLIFIGTGHRRFEAYGANTPAQVDFRVVRDRVTEVTLESAELEQIIAALISPRTEQPLWQEDVVKANGWLLNQMATEARKLGLFSYLPEPELRQHIVENIYPMHPMATHCLTRMSQELGSAARSVVSFFQELDEKAPPGGYSWFVRTRDVTQSKGILSIYTPDLLAAYFRPDIASTNLSVRPEIRDHIRNYLAAVDEAQRFAYGSSLSKEIDPFTQRVLNLLLVYRVANVNVTLQTLEYGLHLIFPADKSRLKSELKSLIANRILFQSPSGEYEFRRSNMADLDALINETRQSILVQPLDVAERVTSLFNRKCDPYTEAKRHNLDYAGDKRLLRVFALPQDLTQKHKLSNGSEVSFWDYHEERRASQVNWGDRYDGTMVYVLCEDEQDIHLAQQGVRSNSRSHIIVGVPKSPLPIKDVLVDLVAIQAFQSTEIYDKLQFQEKAVADEMLGTENQKTGRIGGFLRARERYLEAKGLHWYREDGKTLMAEPITEFDPAEALMNRLFIERNKASHDYLNKAHPRSFSGPKDAALRDAVAKLADFEKPVAINKNEGQNRGEIRYLQLALVNQGVLVQEGDYDNNTGTYQLESNPAKYKDKFPALAALIGQITQIKRGEVLKVWEELSKLTQAPYGVGPYALSIFVACAVRHFGDELRLRLNPTGLGYASTSDPETLINLATGKYPQATIEKRVLNEATARLINDIYNLFAESPAPAGTHLTLAETWRILQGWWNKRTRLERAVGIYPDDGSAEEFVELLARTTEKPGGSQVILEEIKQLYGYNADADLVEEDATEIIQRLKQDKQEIETRASAIKAGLVTKLAALFGPEGETYLDYQKAINNWYGALHQDQKLTTAEWQTAASRSILHALQRLQDVERTFLEIIPPAPGFGFGRVDDWSYDQSGNYLGQFENALTLIQNSLPKVPEPKWETSIEPSMRYQADNLVKFSGSVSLGVRAPVAGVRVRVTRNENPVVAKQFIAVEGNARWTDDITESCSYYLVSENSQGELGRVVRISFANQDDGFKLIAESAPTLTPVDRTYRFRNPVDRHGLVVLLKDIITRVKGDGLVPPDEIAAAFREAAVSELPGNEE